MEGPNLFKAPMLASPNQSRNLIPESKDPILYSGLYVSEANDIALPCTWMLTLM